MKRLASVYLSALAALPALWACGRSAPTVTSSQSGHAVHSSAVSLIQTERSRIESLPESVDPQSAKQLQSDTLRAINALSSLKGMDERLAALSEVRAIQFSSQKQAARVTSSESRTVLLQLWNDAVEMEIVLRRIYEEQIKDELNTAVGSLETNATIAAASELRAIGGGDFPAFLIDALQDTADTQARSALIGALAKAGRGGLGSAWIYNKFIAHPTRELLVALMEAEMPTTKALEALRSRRYGDGEWSGGADASLKAAALDAFHFVAFSSPEGFRKEQEQKDAERERIRKVARDALSVLAQRDPEVISIAAPLINPLKAGRDAEGYFAYAQGIKVREGDVLMYRFTPQGYGWEAFSSSPARLSHVAMVTFSDAGRPLLADQGYSSVDFTDFEEGLRRGMYSTLVRDTTLTPAGRQKLRSAMVEMGRERRLFDYRFNMEESQNSYCAELIYDAYLKAGLPTTFPLYTFRHARSRDFLKQMGVMSDNFATPGTFPSDSRFAYLGHVYQHSANQIVTGRAVVDTMFSTFSRSTWTDFSKAKGQGATAFMVNLFRTFHIGGLEIMTEGLAKNVRSLDGSLNIVLKETNARLQSRGASLENIAEYRDSAETIAEEIISDVYKDSFKF